MPYGGDGRHIVPVLRQADRVFPRKIRNRCFRFSEATLWHSRCSFDPNVGRNKEADAS